MRINAGLSPVGHPSSYHTVRPGLTTYANPCILLITGMYCNFLFICSETHASVLSPPSEGDRNRPSNMSRPYTVTSSVRGSKPSQPMNTKEPPPCPPGVKPMQVLPSEVNFSRPSDAARAAYAERRQAGSSPATVSPPPSNPSYNARPSSTSKPKPPATAGTTQTPHCHGCGQVIQ